MEVYKAVLLDRMGEVVMRCTVERQLPRLKMIVPPELRWSDLDTELFTPFKFRVFLIDMKQSFNAQWMWGRYHLIYVEEES